MSLDIIEKTVIFTITMANKQYNLRRHLHSALPEGSERSLVLLTGARQTGKTTLAKMKWPGLRYINLDAPENRELFQEMPSASWKREIGEAVIDEAQKEPVVFEKIKYAFDERSINFGVLLGSSQILLLKRIRETLAGRISLYEIWPLTISELHQGLVSREEGRADSEPIPKPLIDAIISGKSLSEVLDDVATFLLNDDDAVRRSAEDYFLRWGGMPALLPLDEEQRWKWLRDYEYTYLERDLADLARLDDLAPFRKFQKLSALRSGSLVNYSALARDAGISVDTARRYLEYLRISYQVVLLQPYRRNVTSSVVKTPKLIWIDPGILRTLTGFRGESTGAIYESSVTAEVIKWIRTASKDAEVFFYKTRSGMEVDLLVKTPHGIIGFEMKAGTQIGSSDYRSLRDLGQALGSEWLGGIVVHRGRKIEKLNGPACWAVPAYRLFT